MPPSKRLSSTLGSMVCIGHLSFILIQKGDAALHRLFDFLGRYAWQKAKLPWENLRADAKFQELMATSPMQPWLYHIFHCGYYFPMKVGNPGRPRPDGYKWNSELFSL